ncbi:MULTISPECIES: TonB-dependent siderophore receptor [unclassified Janthinobacterium]|uniref:TonB-dependent receptor plug domain-containing protein n=1 Tax=unclassified Janthinobacterium TaxID=2610881 RepID=UPI00180D0E0D|nr:MULTISPECIES: TonB-dependent receptor [unclassified Janthinobacterium]MBB5368037.1 iron complex outermembrane receptor protein [Janthinobacterium sp. K2C7]MBB5379485.1 iron complex outermembrane receptor protein [Janthinobacterium sp. K2Li3]MBB5386419.1 iron complex outermembrane receptor protein [Janthinobacterium sp. K2E3]
MTLSRTRIASAVALFCAMNALFVASAQASGDAPAAPAPDGAQADAAPQAVIVTGTRGSNRTQFDTMAPVDVFNRDDISAVKSSDLNDVLAQLVPSYVVQRLPMADGQVFVRPATLRGLSPDQTLVLVNGKRFHRSALLGARGAQAADLAQIPVSAIKRIEVLRDGASAQYGSDAIAGVINIILDDSVGTEMSVRHSQYSEGDGKANELNVRSGFAIGETGKLSLYATINQSDPTSRTRQRPDAIAFQAAHPNLDVPNPVQRWGQPKLSGEHVGYNGSVSLSDDVELYSFGMFSHSDGTSDFNWRNPDTSTGAFKVTPLFPGWDLRSLYPVGFSPQYSNKQNDAQVVAGLRGHINERLGWDVSASYGMNHIDYNLANSINASMGPSSPTSFYLGQLSQEEKILNANFNYELPMASLAQPVNIAFGTEARNETYGVKAGDLASYTVGPGAAVGLDANANGAPGFSDRQAGSWGQTSYAGYLDVEVPVTRDLSLGGAARYEHFSEFGSTVNGKLSARYTVTPDIAVRGSYSTGFRAPTPGQSNTNSTNQGLDTKTLLLFTSGRLANNDPLAILLGAKPLKPEKSKNLSLGFTWKTPAGFSGSVDVYNIKVSDRFSTSASFAVPAGVANPLHYTSISYFTNDFDTTTRGIDIVGNHTSKLGDGRLNLTLAYNYNTTKVDGGNSSIATNDAQRTVFEEHLPRQKATLGATYDLGQWSSLARWRYYGAWTDNTGNATGDVFQRFSAIQFLDLALSYKINAMHTVRVGIDNALNKYPDEATFQASRGLIYSRNAPYDTDGRSLFAEYRVKF